MITCPNCKAQLLEGAFFCEECGSEIIPVDRLATQSIRRMSTNNLRFAHIAAHPGEMPAVPQADAQGFVPSLHLVDAGQVIHLDSKYEYTLGRAAEGQARRPDIDLSAFDAFGQGVSRIHAAIRISGQRVTIVDLGSSNGTRVNGQKINPHSEILLHHGDMLALGKLKIQFLVRK